MAKASKKTPKRELPTGALETIPVKTPFARTTSILPDGSVDASFTVMLDKDAKEAFIVRSRFTFAGASDEATKRWAMKALIVDVQARIRRMANAKDVDERAKALLRETWATIEVKAPDENRGGSPEAREASDKRAMLRTIAIMRAKGQNAAADALQAAM